MSSITSSSRCDRTFLTWLVMRMREARLLALLVFDEFDSNLRPVDPDHFATAESQASGGQHEEEFFRLQNFGRPFDLELGAACGDIEQVTGEPPCAVHAHQVDG